MKDALDLGRTDAGISAHEAQGYRRESGLIRRLHIVMVKERETVAAVEGYAACGHGIVVRYGLCLKHNRTCKHITQ